MGYSKSLTTRRRNFAYVAQPAVDPNTSYAGVLSTPFVTPAFKLADTLNKGFVRQIDGIQSKAVISSLTSSDPMQAANCEWVDGADLTLGERVLTLTDLAVMQSLCRGTLLPTWAGMTGNRETMTAGSPEFVNFTMATVAAASAQSVENAIWKSNSVFAGGFLSNDGVFDNGGYRASILGGAGTVIADAICTEKVVSANGFGANQLELTGCWNEVYSKALASVPGILNQTDIAFLCSPKTAGHYMHELATAGGSGYQVNVTNQAFDNLQYLGIPIHVCPGFPDDCLILTPTSNLVVGSNANTDYTSAQYIDSWKFSGSDEVRIAIRFGLGCQVGIPADCVVGALTAIITDPA